MTVAIDEKPSTSDRGLAGEGGADFRPFLSTGTFFYVQGCGSSMEYRGIALEILLEISERRYLRRYRLVVEWATGRESVLSELRVPCLSFVARCEAKVRGGGEGGRVMLSELLAYATGAVSLCYRSC